MPVLQEDGTIRFRSLEEFVRQYEEKISHAEMMVESQEAWLLGSKHGFKLQVPPEEEGVPVDVTIMSSSGGRIGVELDADEKTWRAMAGLMAKLLSRSLKEAKAASAQEAAEPPAPRKRAPSTRVRAPSGTVPASTAPPQRGGEMPPRRAAAKSKLSALKQGAAVDTGGDASTQEPAVWPPPELGGFTSEETGDAGMMGVDVGSRTVRPSARAKAISLRGKVVVHEGTEDFTIAEPMMIDETAMARITLPRLFASVSKALVPLKLTIQTKKKEYLFHFNMRGNLAKFEGPGSETQLLERLTKDGKLTKEQREVILDDSNEEKSAEEVMLQRKMIRPRDYWFALRDLAIEALMDIHTLKGGEFELHSEPIKRRTGIPFGSLVIPWFETGLKLVSPEEVNRVLQDYWYKFPIISDTAPWNLGSLDLEKRAHRFLEVSLVGTMNLDHIRKTSPLGSNNTKRLLVALKAIGLYNINDSPVVLESDETPEDRLYRELKRMNKQNMFEQLGVHWSAHPNGYPKALQRIKEEFGPKSKWIKYHPETKAQCDKIIELADKAAQYLKVASQRRTYREKYIAPFQMESSAFLLYKQAELMYFRKQIRECKETLEMCMEMDPKPIYRTLLQKVGG